MYDYITFVSSGQSCSVEGSGAGVPAEPDPGGSCPSAPRERGGRKILNVDITVLYQRVFNLAIKPYLPIQEK